MTSCHPHVACQPPKQLCHLGQPWFHETNLPKWVPLVSPPVLFKAESTLYVGIVALSSLTTFVSVTLDSSSLVPHCTLVVWMELHSRTSDQPVTYGSLPDIYITPIGPSYHPAELHPPPPSRETQATHNRELLILAWPLIPCFFSKIAIHWLPYHKYNITQKSKLANRAVSPKHHTCQKRPMTNPASSANKMILLSSNTIYNHLSKKSILTIKEIHINLTNHKDKRQKKSATGFGLVNGNNINLIHHGSDPEPDPKLHRTIPLKGLFWHDQIIATNPNLKTLILSWCHFYIITSLGW